MDDLIRFLRHRLDDQARRLDEDEKVAKAALWAGDEGWKVLPGQEQPFHRPWQVIDGTYEEAVVWVKPTAADDEGVAVHVARFHPLRILADVEQGRRDIHAKRTLLDEFSWEDGEARAVMHLAQQYSDHPEFRDEWRTHVPTNVELDPREL